MPTPQETKRVLEASLRENPDDLATHQAYADVLTELGDPRGEFISVQLALEDESHLPAQRKKLQQREQELLHAHERAWLGHLAPLLKGSEDDQRLLLMEQVARTRESTLEQSLDFENLFDGRLFTYSWARGWLHTFGYAALSVEMARQLARLPAAQMLQRLICTADMATSHFLHEPDADLPADPQTQVCELFAQYPLAKNLRAFQFGRSADAERDRFSDGNQYRRLAPMVEAMPRLEELSIFGHIYIDHEMWDDMNRMLSSPTLSNLRVFQHYHATTYALESFSTNSALSNLTHLLIYPHCFNRPHNPETGHRLYDQGPALHRANVRFIFNSPFLRLLTHLQLRGCNGGDGMIVDLVRSGMLKHLKVLDLRHGHVTDEGAQRLARCQFAKRLDVLDLRNNRLTEVGIAALERRGIKLRAQQQQTVPYDDQAILYIGDTE